MFSCAHVDQLFMKKNYVLVFLSPATPPALRIAASRSSRGSRFGGGRARLDFFNWNGAGGGGGGGEGEEETFLFTPGRIGGGGGGRTPST